MRRGVRTMSRLLVVIALGLLSAVATAQDPVPGEREHVQAIEALRENRLVDAERLIRESLAINTWTRPVFTHAEILEALGRPLDAIRLYEELASGSIGVIEPEAMALVRAALARANAQVAHLDVRWNAIEGAVRVRIDGVAVEEVGENSARVPVNPGPRLVRLESRGRDAMERRVQVERGVSTDVTFEWSTSASGRVMLRADGATISVAGHTAEGQLTLSLEPGTYEVVVTSDHGSRHEDIEVQGGETARYEFSAPRRRSRAWIWVLAGAVVVGAAVAAGVLLSGDDIPQLPVDDLGT